MSNKIAIGGGNKQKGIPPTATNYFGILGKGNNLRIKACMSDKTPHNWLDVFDIDGSQKIKLAQSGSGLGYSSSTFPINPLTSTGYWGATMPAGELSTNYGIVGFTSTTPYYISFSGRDDYDIGASIGIIDTGTPAAYASQISDYVWNHATRYLISKHISSINIEGVSSWDQLKNVTITWIAGDNTNGGDKPDVKAFSDVSLNGWQWVPPLRRAENLSAEFLDEDFNSIAKVDLWKTKQDPTTAEILAAVAAGVSVYASLPSYTYVGTSFTSTTINYDSFGVSLINAKYFLIRQAGNTGRLDNYGVSDVRFDFDTNIYW